MASRGLPNFDGIIVTGPRGKFIPRGSQVFLAASSQRPRKVRCGSGFRWSPSLRSLAPPFPPKTADAGFWAGPRFGRSLAPPFPNGTAYPQGVRRIRKAAKPPTAAQALGAAGGPVLPPAAYFLYQQKVCKEWPKGYPLRKPLPAWGTPYADERPQGVQPRSAFLQKAIVPTAQTHGRTDKGLVPSRWDSVCLFVPAVVTLLGRRFT